MVDHVQDVREVVGLDREHEAGDVEHRTAAVVLSKLRTVQVGRH